MLERIVEPLLAGIYAGDTFKLSLKSTFPQFRAMEQKNRSLILGMMASRKNVTEESAHLPAAVRNSVFVTFKRGLQIVSYRLSRRFKYGGFTYWCWGCIVAKLEGQQTEVIFEDGHREIVDGVIVTTPTYQAAKLLSELPAASELNED